MDDLNNTAVQIAQIQSDSALEFVIVVGITVVCTAWILAKK